MRPSSSASWTRTNSSGTRHHHPGQEHGDPLSRTPRSTSSTRPATPTSAARSSAPSRWSTASCCSSMPRKARCRRPAMCSRRPSKPSCRPSWSSIRSTVPTPAPQEVLNEVYDLFIDLDAERRPARLPRPLHQRQAGHCRRSTSTPRAPTCSLSSRPSSRTFPRPAATPDGAAADPGHQPRLL